MERKRVASSLAGDTVSSHAEEVPSPHDHTEHIFMWWGGDFLPWGRQNSTDSDQRNIASSLPMMIQYLQTGMMEFASSAGDDTVSFPAEEANHPLPWWYIIIKWGGGRSLPLQDVVLFHVLQRKQTSSSPLDDKYFMWGKMESRLLAFSPQDDTYHKEALT